VENQKIIPVRFYKEESGREPVRLWLLELSSEDRKIIGKNIRTLQIDWPINSSLIKSLGGGLWEIRSSLDNRISRILFVIKDGTIILLHGFIKKTQKTPIDALELAKKRLKKL
jgi:phage-related protein